MGGQGGWRAVSEGREPEGEGRVMSPRRRGPMEDDVTKTGSDEGKEASRAV